MAEYYNWIKAFHLIFVISWMAGLFYLPRLFVYHCGFKSGSESDILFQIMEKRIVKNNNVTRNDNEPCVRDMACFYLWF